MARKTLPAIALGATLALSLTSNSVHAAEPRMWSDGPMAVAEVDAIPGGNRICGFLNSVGNLQFGIVEQANGDMYIGLSFLDHTKWSNGGQVTMKVNGNTYTINATLNPDDPAYMRAFLGNVSTIVGHNDDAVNGGRDFLHDLFNGDSLTLGAGPAYYGTFTLTGSAKAIVALHNCGSSIRNTTTAANRPTPAPAPTHPAVPNYDLPNHPTEVALTESHGVAQVDAIVNGTLHYPFVIDSGAGDVSLPIGLAKVLAANGSLTQDDYVGEATYTMANGTQEKEPQYRLRSLKIGDYVLTNVLCSVTSHDSEALLGQSFLKRLAGWSIDNARGVLIIK